MSLWQRFKSYLNTDHRQDNPLLAEHLSPTQYQRLYAELVEIHPENQREYFRFHRKRYYELFNAMAYYLANRPSARVLESGVSGFLPLYKKLFPNIALVTLDRPIADNGVDTAYCVGHCHAEQHYNLNLNDIILSPTWGTPPLGKFDYIIFTEVLEHLTINPIELLSSLLSLLNPDGYLYLTTPNFFQRANLEKIQHRENPQHIFPRRGENWDAHHHYREYEMNELIRFIRGAGGQVINSYYSDCWDNLALAQTVLRLHPEQRSNLTLVAKAENA